MRFCRPLGGNPHHWIIWFWSTNQMLNCQFKQRSRGAILLPVGGNPHIHDRHWITQYQKINWSAEQMVIYNVHGMCNWLREQWCKAVAHWGKSGCIIGSADIKVSEDHLIIWTYNNIHESNGNLQSAYWWCCQLSRNSLRYKLWRWWCC